MVRSLNACEIKEIAVMVMYIPDMTMHNGPSAVRSGAIPAKSTHFSKIPIGFQDITFLSTCTIPPASPTGLRCTYAPNLTANSAAINAAPRDDPSHKTVVHADTWSISCKMFLNLIY